nr:unnamed protein product [Callosobruchus chinensis]
MDTKTKRESLGGTMLM